MSESNSTDSNRKTRDDRERIDALGMRNLERWPHSVSAPHYKGRGFSDRTVEALITGGYEFPEQLLAVNPSELKAIKGIGPKALSEIAAYKQKFGS